MDWNQKKIQNQKPTYQNSPSNFIQKFDQIVNYSSQKKMNKEILMKRGQVDAINAQPYSFNQPVKAIELIPFQQE